MITSLPLQRPAPAVSRVWIAIALFVLLLGAGALVYAQIEGDRGIPPIASGGDFEVSGVKVDGSGKNADEARSNAWRDAQRNDSSNRTLRGTSSSPHRCDVGSRSRCGSSAPTR